MRGNERADGQAPRLVHIELRPLGDDGTLVVTPAGDSFEIAAPPDALWEVLSRFDGTRSLDEVVAGTPDPDGYREVVDELVALGAISAGPAPTRAADWSRFPETGPDGVGGVALLLLGDEALTALAAELAGGSSWREVIRTSAEELSDALDAAGDAVVLAVRDRIDVPFLEWLNDLCAGRGTRWSQFHVSEGKGWAGPTVRPGFTPDYRDLLGRRRTAADRLDVLEALLSPTVHGAAYLPPVSELRWMLGYLLIDLERWVAGAPDHTTWAEVELNPVDLQVVRHPVLQLPDRPLDPSVVPEGETADFDALCDTRTGLITGLPLFPHHESVPDRLITVQSNVADMRRLYTWANNMVCGGSKFDDAESARLSAIGEAVERYCGNAITDKVKVREASYAQLRDAGDYALDPDRLVLYSDKLYDSPGFPFVRFDEQLSTHWVQGWSLTRQEPIWVPASTIYVNWYIGEFSATPPTNFLYYPGIAAGPSLDWAVASGIEEIIERDATMIWWMNGHPLPKVKMTSELSALWAGTPERMGQQPYLIHLDNEFDFPVFAGVLLNEREGYVNVGFAARPDPFDAARKAWAEALTLQDGSRDMNQPGGLTRGAIQEGWMTLELKPYREDRRYLDDYAPDFHDVNDLMNQQQVFLDPRAADRVRPWLDPAGEREFDSVPSFGARSADAYRELVESRGYEVIYVDLTTQDVARAGLRVVRVLVPGLVPNFPAAFPFLGKRRIQEVPVRLGWRDEPLAEEDLNYVPIPHA
ncbi:YcaO-like family protein [Saccharothrix xinjiangensis]|uniref:YcaO-like family protein n=1 Tax=Saccharothrix xinjiangensis TaxID=204798 RepID=A0ABV9XW51_9PSEU